MALVRSNVAKVSPFPRQAQVILHKSINYLGTGTPVCRRQFFRMPAGGKFLLHMAQKVKPARTQFHAIARWPRRCPACGAAQLGFVNHKLRRAC